MCVCICIYIYTRIITYIHICTYCIHVQIYNIYIYILCIFVFIWQCVLIFISYLYLSLYLYCEVTFAVNLLSTNKECDAILRYDYVRYLILTDWHLHMTSHDHIDTWCALLYYPNLDVNTLLWSPVCICISSDARILQWYTKVITALPHSVAPRGHDSACILVTRSSWSFWLCSTSGRTL